MTLSKNETPFKVNIFQTIGHRNLQVLSYSFIFLLILSCNAQTSQQMNSIPEGKNRLHLSSSPYLLQHADNPVDWFPWGEEALKKAKEEDKPILVSIGYSSCHWCHVMAHESFEDSATAAMMNKSFVNIKIDREERPDIDQIYMDAVQAMGLNGGWPLNVFLTPDQKPFYGGTYFPKENWQSIIKGIDEAFIQNREKLNESADNFAQHISRSEIEKYGLKEEELPLSLDELNASYEALAKKFDYKWGGLKRAPKFPMPSIWQWMLAYSNVTKSSEALDHVLFTLDKIGEGGIYDHVGGGFARYSVDGEWHVPHFEKMLYDNGQLLSLYAQAYSVQQKPTYKSIIEETLGWLEREMLDQSGGLYAALDADSEGEEGKFYVWSEKEIEEIAGEKAKLIKRYFDVSGLGNWEGTNVLRRLQSDEKIAEKLDLTLENLEQIITEFKEKALAERAKRIRPGLDNKIIAGWNGLALSGLCDAFVATESPTAEKLAHRVADFLKKEMIDNDKLLRVSGQETEGFLEDYAAVINGLIRYYEVFLDESYLQTAKALTNTVIEDFYDSNEKLFFYTGKKAENLIARKKEIFDNVIPSSNSIISGNLWKLGIMYDDSTFLNLHREMENQVKGAIRTDVQFMSNWAITATSKLTKGLEIVIIGEDHQAYSQALQKTYHPHRVILGAKTSSENIPLMEYKTTTEGKTTIYVCSEKVCRQPVTSIEKAEAEINRLIGK